MISNPDKQKGSVLFFVIIILAVMSSALVALVSITAGQIKGMIMLSDSAIAFCAADSGTDKSLYRLFKNTKQPIPWVPNVGELIYPDNVAPQTCPSASWETFGPNSEVEYQVCVDINNPLVFSSLGNYKATGIKRKLEIDLN
jgi:hypothetical protein